MKKHFYYAMLFLLFLTASCVSEKIETPEDKASYNPETVWAYDGDNTTLSKVIQELKSSPNREKLERRLLKNDVLWKESKFVIIDNKKRILVPFLSINKDNVIGVLSLVKDSEGKTTFDMVVRKDLMTKSATLPFWKRGIWAGYFMALDKDILEIKNGSPGLMEKPVAGKVKSSTSKTMEIVCGDVPVSETCITYSECDSYDYGETLVNCYETGKSCWYNYEWSCWDVPDETTPTDPVGQIDPPCPTGYERDANGNCVDICINTDPSSALYDQVSSVEFMGSEFTSKSQDLNTTSKNLKWRLKVGPLTYVMSTEEGVLKQVNNPSHPYEWESLTHKTLSLNSTEIHIEVTVLNHTGVETLGLYNAVMDLSFDLRASVECKGVLFGDSQSYTGRKIFTTSDFGIY